MFRQRSAGKLRRFQVWIPLVPAIPAWTTMDSIYISELQTSAFYYLQHPTTVRNRQFLVAMLACLRVARTLPLFLDVSASMRALSSFRNDEIIATFTTTTVNFNLESPERVYVLLFLSWVCFTSKRTFLRAWWVSYWS